MANRTVGQKLGLGFAATLALTVAIGAIAVYALQNVVESKDRVVIVDAPQLADAQALRAARETKGSESRGFLLTREEQFLAKMQTARAEIAKVIERLRSRAGSAEMTRLIDEIATADRNHQEEIEKVITMRRGDATIEAVAKAFDVQVGPRRTELDVAIANFITAQMQHLEAARVASSDSASSAKTLVLVIGLAALLVGIAVAVTLSRSLARQIGNAVAHVQSSSAELQTAANQQATASKEQATAMNEITTTISELLATSRQIAESAQRVAQIAGQTATSARAGDTTVEKAHESILGIRRQVDLVVGHMLELGNKSQQIGSVLDIVSELAEQTNILAINATIEAAGAGDSGRRFAVVADEIRKLADRVASSTKEIRGLIDDVRSAVNTTVMATETGSKAVDGGSRQFGDVASAFKQIAGLVGTTTEAAREIELSTKQQTTAVEQVNMAIANVAQATRETEVSSGQTLLTASQLAGLSKDLMRLVRAEA
jgi:methyl-accepting chemotaxis protein